MFLSKHKNGFYYIYYFDPLTEKRKSISSKCKTKKEALSFLTLFNQSIDRTKQNPIFPISLKKFLWEYLKYSESVHTLNTTKTFKTTFNGILNYLGEISLGRITSKNISEYLQFRRRNVSIYQARKDLINLNSAFNKAIVDKYLYSNPCEGIKRIQLPEKQPRFFSEDDLERLIRVIDNNDLIDLVGFAVNTGLRKMELIELQWEQIDFNGRYIILNNQNSITKSKRIRTIPLNSLSLNILEKRKKSAINKYVFTYKDKMISSGQLSRILKVFIIKAKVNPKLNFHSLRHTFASRLVQKGVSIYHVSKLLGHASVTTTQIYAHLRTDDLRASVELLE